MSETLKTVLINDSRIEDISSEISFKVEGGANQATYQSQNFNTSSNSSHSINFNPPSENIVIDRRMLIDSDVSFVITVTNVTVGAVAFNWGSTDAFGPYPMNSLYLTQTTSINNCSLSVNTQDVMAPLLRMNDQSIHTHYDGFTPSMVDDCYYNYSDAIGANNNPLSTMNNNGFNNKLRPRGAHSITSMAVEHQIYGAGTDSSMISTNVLDTWTIELTTHFTEPLLFLSPFLSNPCVANEAGFLGINNLSFTFNLDNSTNLRRVFRTANAWTYTYALATTSSSGSGFSNLKMLVNYLSVQPSQYAKISAKNVLPLLQYDRYLTSNNSSSALTAGSSATYTSSNVALNQIPDLIMIFARVPIATQTSKNSDSFAVINGVSVNFNNVSGILSNATQQELWILSQKAGSSQSWPEFSGYTNTSSATGLSSSIPTTGSILVLQPAYSFNLPEFLSASSLGSYNLQFNLSITNQSSTSYIPEIVVITVTSGYITTHQGATSSFSGVLNKEMVMSARDGASVPRLSQSDYERLVGGVMGNRGVMNMHKYFKNKRSGNVMSAGVMSGGVMSGGASRLGKYIK